MKLNSKREVLDEKGISRTWLSKKLVKSFNAVDAYVCDRTRPNIETLFRISEISNVDLKKITSEDSERNIDNIQLCQNI